MIAIDPGLTGALALFADGNLVTTADMPVMVRGKGTAKVKNEVNAAGLAQLLRSWVHVEQFASVRVVSEVVNSRPTAGPPQLCPACNRDRKALGSSSVFAMGDTAGAIRGVFAALGVAVTYVAPVTWKGHFNLRGGQDQKEAARAHAIRLYPGADLARKKDHNRAEAILIGRWYLNLNTLPAGDPF